MQNPKSGGIIFERRGQRIFLHLKKGEENFSKSEKNRGGEGQGLFEAKISSKPGLGTPIILPPQLVMSLACSEISS